MVENNERLKNSEQLLEDLYLNLRQKLLKWAHITSQTPQARMGYVGQHLTSIVTGYSGGKSGARAARAPPTSRPAHPGFTVTKGGSRCPTGSGTCM